MATLTIQTPEEKAYFENKGQAPNGEAKTDLEKQVDASKGAIADKLAESGERTRDESGRFTQVPLPALQEERRERQAAQQRERELAERYARLEERTNTILQSVQQESLPEFEKDPLTNLHARQEKTEKGLAEWQSWKDSQDKNNQTTQQFNQFYNNVQSQLGAYMQEHPDYKDAHNYYFGEVAADLKEMGYDATTIDNYIRDTVLRISAKALQDGVNPGSRIAAIAKRRGFKAPEKDQTAEEKVKQLASNQQASRSLGAAPGGKGAELTAKSLADMPQEEFAKLWLNKSARRKLLS